MLKHLKFLPADYEARAQATFFALMMCGYGSGTKPKARRHLDLGLFAKYFRIVLPDGWHGVDEWRESTLLGHYSSGSTLIYFKKVLVWEMHYSGWYLPEAIPTLKLALRQNYEASIWNGGRGPIYYPNDPCGYGNYPVGDGSFGRFSGTEYITMADSLGYPKTLGKHNYSGGFLFPTATDQLG